MIMAFWNRHQVPILAITFASSGAALNLLQQQLYYAGAGDGTLLILIVPTFVGMMIGGLASKDTRRELFSSSGSGSGSNKGKSLHHQHQQQSELFRRMKQIIAVSISDVTSLTLRSMSQNLCGSGMFTVIYASLPAFNGVLSYFFLNRILTKYQWMSMAVVVLGLACSAEAEEGDLEGGVHPDEKAMHRVATGILLGLAGTLFSAASYVCAERVLKSPDAPKYPTTLTAINGINDLLLTLPWLLSYSIPHRQELLYEPVAAKGQSPIWLLFLWLCLVASNAAHLNACYMLLQITESVTLTMLQGVRAVMVFVISGALFCSPKSPEQCLSIQKSICSFVVLCGVVMYAKSTAGLSKHINVVGSSSGNSSGSGSSGGNGSGSDYKAIHDDDDADIDNNDHDENGDMGIVVKECPSSATKAERLDKRVTSRSSSYDSMTDNL